MDMMNSQSRIKSLADPEIHFALDVGTRKVAGLLVKNVDGKGHILATSVMEHPERAMLDGQVHHIEKASTIVKQVKEDLEKITGMTLKSAHVAVAGRSLLTQSATVVQDLASKE